MSQRMKVFLTILDVVASATAIYSLPSELVRNIAILVLLVGLAAIWVPDMIGAKKRKEAIATIAAIIALGLLVFSAREIWHRLHPPHPTIARISYKVNKGPTVEATLGDIIELKRGEKICLVAFTYSSSGQGPRHGVQGEAYVQKGPRGDEDIDWKDGRFTKGAAIEQGEHEIGDFKLGPHGELNPCWTVQSGWNRIIVVLVHYYPYGHAVDDRFYLTLAIE